MKIYLEVSFQKMILCDPFENIKKLMRPCLYERECVRERERERVHENVCERENERDEKEKRLNAPRIKTQFSFSSKY